MPTAHLGKLRQKGEEEEGGLRIEQVDDEAVPEKAPVRVVSEPCLDVGLLTAKDLFEPEPDQVSRTRILDDAEGEHRGGDQRREPDGSRDDMDERCRMDAEVRDEARKPPLLGGAGDDIE